VSGRRHGGWFAAAVLASFAAGIAIGLAVPRAADALGANRDRGPNDAYVREITRRYDLDAGQVRLLRMVLESRDRELAGLDPRSPEGEARALAANLRTQERIKYVLNAEQRARFLQDSELAEPPSSTEGNDALEVPGAEHGQGR
jgi:hypothetical protein